MRKHVKLGDIANIYSGGTPSRTKPNFWGGNIPWVKTTQIQNCVITEKDVDEWITPEGMKKSSAKMVPRGTILMAMYGQGKTRGQVAVLGIDATINQACAAIIVKDSADSNYIYQQLLYRYSSIRNLSNTGSQENLNSALIKSIAFSLPDLISQKNIAILLSIWDRAIDKAGRLIAVKEKKFVSLSNRCLFGGNPLTMDVSKNTRWFSVPAHWKIVRIGSVAKEVKSTNGSVKKIPVLSCTKYDGLVDSLTYFDKQIFSVDRSNYKVVSRGQFAYATNHIEEGSIGYQELYEKGLVSPMYTVFQTDNSIDDTYLYQVLKTNIYLHIFRVNTSSSVDRRGSLRWKEFAKLPVPLPPMNEQKKISTLLKTARQEIDFLKKQLEAYRQQKRGLMQKLLTGQWRVKIKEEHIGNG
ncbi:MAG: restriction endonuclease subunit S [Smithellaceae bacterium]|nr:restriction endonuclease subunit S [Smithellaceae bacterium]